MVFGGGSLLTHLASVLQDLLTSPLQSSYIFLIWIYLSGWDSLDLLSSVPSVPHPSRVSRCAHHHPLFRYPPCWVILFSIVLFHNSTSYIHPASTITLILHSTYLWFCRLYSLIYLSPVDHISHNHHWYTQFCAFHSPSLEESSPVLLEESSPPVPVE